MTGHHSIKVTVDVYGHLVPGANKAAVDRLDAQALAAYEARNPTQPPRNLAPSEHTRGVTDCAVTPRKDLVELRGVELKGNMVDATEDELLALPSSGRGRR